MTATIHTGDALSVLRTLPAASVHCCVTSPPYWGLRDYGTATWHGGDVACQHVVGELRTRAGLDASSEAHGGGGSTALDDCPLLLARNICPHCGARRIDHQIGLEQTPAEFVASLVAVFEEVRRVLRDDGCCWVNLGDSYAAFSRSGAVDRIRDDKRGYRGDRLANGRGDQDAVLRVKTRATRDGSHAGKHTAITAAGPMVQPNRMPIAGLKPKDLVGIPWRVAFALQEAGWWLRSDCIWSKPNPMPESVEDRPTKAHEYVFLLTKSERYFYDAFAVRQKDGGRDHPRNVIDAPDTSGGFLPTHNGLRTRGGRAGQGANLRTVWTIPTQPFKGAHFATFPKELADRCILAGTSAHGCCSSCGSPWQRITETTYEDEGRRSNGPRSIERRRREFGTAGYEQRLVALRASKGWQPTCECDAGVVPCTVLDPFTGAGTTGLAATLLGRNFLGVELNVDFAAMARKRIDDEMPLFARAVGGSA